METAYIDDKPDLEPDLTEVDANTTIVSGEEVEPSMSIWDGIMGLVEDMDRDTLIDVSYLLFDSKILSAVLLYR